MPFFRVKVFGKKGTLVALSALLLLLSVIIYSVRQPQQIKQNAATRADVPITIIIASDFQRTGDPMLSTTSDLAISQNPDYVLTVGDHSDQGTTSTYQSSFTPSWGRLMNKIYPVPGNHDRDPGNLNQYMQYFSSRINGSNAYYSVNLGSWHIVALDSTGDIPSQTTWLQQDLAANPNKPILAFWHFPRWSTDSAHGNNSISKPWWDVLYSAHADIIVNGHVHTYQRYAQMDGSGNLKADGIREFVDGTAGASPYAFGTTDNKQEYRDGSPGFIKLTLSSTSYSWAFVKADGQAIDQGTAAIHNMPLQIPTYTPNPTPTISAITPTWFCGGSGACVPSASPTPQVATPTTMPEITDTPYPTQSFTSPTIDPCLDPSASSSSRERSNNKPKKGLGSMFMEFIQQLFQFFFQLLMNILSGNFNPPTPTPTPSTMPSAAPTNLPPTTGPTSALSPTAGPTSALPPTAYPTINPCAHLTPSVTPISATITPEASVTTAPSVTASPTLSTTSTPAASPTLTATSTPTASPLSPSPLLSVTITPVSSASPTTDPCAVASSQSVREVRSNNKPKHKHKHEKKKHGGVGNMMKMLIQFMGSLLETILKLISMEGAKPTPTPTPVAPTAAQTPTTSPTTTIPPTNFPTVTAIPTLNPCATLTPTVTLVPSPTLEPTLSPTPTIPDDQTPTELPISPTYNLLVI